MGLVRANARALLAGVALAAIATAQAAQAQEVNTNTTFMTLLERIVVGWGAKKVAIDTPQAVTVVDQEDIDREQAETIGDILSTVPGVTLIGSERVLGESFNIRGVGTAETSGDESKIIITVDGAKKFYEQYRMGSFFSDPELYKQVEVLRGPASSTLYGSGAMGGVINFTTKDASDFIADGKTGAVRIKQSVNSNGGGTATSALLAQQINDTFDILATGTFRRSNEFILANGSELSGSDFEAWSGLVKGTARFGENDEQVLRLSYQHWDSDARDQDYAQTGTSAAFGTVDRHVTDKTVVLNYENPDAANPLLDLKASLSYSDTMVDQTDAAFTGFALGHYAYQTYQGNLENTSEFTGENWTNYLTVGTQLSYQNRVGYANDTGNPITTHPEGTDTKLGVYAQDEFVLDEKLTIIPGLRADFVHQEPSENVTNGEEINDVALSPKLAALYDINDSVSIFGSIAHTERLPTLDELYTTSSSQGASLDLEKESGNGYEAGFSITGNDILQSKDSVAVKTTAFLNDMTNLIERGSGSTYYVNVGNARIYGIEVEGSYESERLFARLAFTAMHGEDTDTGELLTSIPATKLVATLGARNPDLDLEYGGRVTLAAAADTGVASSVDSTRATDGYATLDLFANWKPQTGPLAGTSVQFGIDNVLNADYRDNQSADPSVGRAFKLTLAKQFDY